MGWDGDALPCPGSSGGRSVTISGAVLVASTHRNAGRVSPGLFRCRGHSSAQARGELRPSLLQQEAWQSPGHLENDPRAAAAAGAVLCRPLLSQALSQPQIIAAFLLLDPAPQASRLLGSWTQPGDRRPIWIDCMFMCPPGKLCSRSEQPPARCHGLVCITPCSAVQREGLGFSVFLFFFSLQHFYLCS